LLIFLQHDGQLMFGSLVSFILNLQLIIDMSYQASLYLCKRHTWSV